MNPWVALVIGLILGWLIEWVIDWIFWRRRGQNVNDVAVDTSQIGRLESEISDLRAENTRLENLLLVRDSQIKDCNNQLLDLQAVSTSSAAVTEVGSQEVTMPDTSVPAAAVTARTNLIDVEVPAVQQDDLMMVSGLNEDTVDRLHQAGIHTYADLGALRPLALREILGESSFQIGDEIEVLKSARMLSGSLKHVDDLEVIHGIGPVIAKVLNNAGIFSFADVADLTAVQLREIVGERIQRLADEESILAHARQLAGRE